MKAKKAKKTAWKPKAINLEDGTSVVDVVDLIGVGVSMIGVEEDSEAVEGIEEAAEGSMIEVDAGAGVAGAAMTGVVGVVSTGEGVAGSVGVETAEVEEVAETVTPGAETGEGSTKEVSMTEKVLRVGILKTRK